MKKLLATLLTMGMVFSCSTVAFATNETVLTTTVPGATYTLNIPANQEIPFGATSTDIGNVTVTDSSGFALGKNLEVTITYDAFKAKDASTTIPYYLSIYGTYETMNSPSGWSPISIEKESGSFLTFRGQGNGTCSAYFDLATSAGTEADNDTKAIVLNAKSSDWGKALAVEYSSTITFTAEVVSSQS